MLFAPKQGLAAAVPIMSNLICYIPWLMLLLSGALTSYPPQFSGSLAGVTFYLFCFLRPRLYVYVYVYVYVYEYVYVIICICICICI